MLSNHTDELIKAVIEEFDSWSLQIEGLENTENEEEEQYKCLPACRTELDSIIKDFEEKVFDEVAFQKLQGLKHLTRRIKPGNTTTNWEMITNSIEFIDDIMKFIYFCVFDKDSYRGAKALETSMEKKLSQKPN